MEMLKAFIHIKVTEQHEDNSNIGCVLMYLQGGTTMKYVCDVCGWEYDEEKGYPEGGIAPGTKWEDIPEDFECPLCFVGKDQFSKAE